ncbi:coiled-coil domain-containing protein 127a [Anguilla anguilla]|uniref:coiled-coil domain-containing protein 127a n=1 Tax=Anguilla anguilla TaxID=7936 RepID=UPI0015B12B8E|nr:coiled-coil domain-containing protein 127a [Anguilla anguilla]XP_035247665.1 coiled-coil domain-containing protein 127a [Anguilla anguilla]
MNNLNDPPGWNFGPDRRGDGDSNKWNYALLVPVLGLAAFHWIWTRESKREIGEVKAGYARDLTAVSNRLERKYRQAMTESRRAAARVELDLEKERQRAQGYRQAVHSQGQQLLEERKRLQEERQALEEEKQRVAQRGAAAVLLEDALGRESERQASAAAVLSEFEAGLVERQSAFCNAFLPRKWRLEMERDLLNRAAAEPLAAELNMESDLEDIFRNDRHCDVLTGDKRKNGSLMWLYLRFWKLQVTLQKHKRAQESLLGVKPNQK